MRLRLVSAEMRGRGRGLSSSRRLVVAGMFEVAPGLSLSSWLVGARRYMTPGQRVMGSWPRLRAARTRRRAGAPLNITSARKRGFFGCDCHPIATRRRAAGMASVHAPAALAITSLEVGPELLKRASNPRQDFLKGLYDGTAVVSELYGSA